MREEMYNRNIRQKPLEEKPDCCHECGGTRILKAESKHAQLRNNWGSLHRYQYSYVYMCCDCGQVLGYADDRFSPDAILAAMYKPDLSAKWEGMHKQ